MYLFDTDAVSHLVKRRPLESYLAWVDSLPAEAMCLCPIVAGELLAGTRTTGADGRRIEALYRDELFPRMRNLPIDDGVVDRYATMRVHLHQARKSIPDNDLWIAAAADSHGMALVTGNLRHYARLEELGLEICRVLYDALQDAARS